MAVFLSTEPFSALILRIRAEISVLPLMGGRVGEWHWVRITTWQRAGCQAEKTKTPGR
jgi:hypothetical protein